MFLFWGIGIWGEKLKKLRDDVAAREGVAPFVILGDVAMRRMAGSLPRTRSDLLKVPGFSARKVRSFGDLFLRLIGRYVAEKKRLG